MYQVQILYPIGKGTTFNWDHYFAVHVPQAMAALRRFSNAVKLEIVQPLDDSPSKINHCVGVITLPDDAALEGFRRLLASDEALPVLADVPNYTTAEAHFVINRVITFDANADRISG